MNSSVATLADDNLTRPTDQRGPWAPPFAGADHALPDRSDSEDQLAHHATRDPTGTPPSRTASGDAGRPADRRAQSTKRTHRYRAVPRGGDGGRGVRRRRIGRGDREAGTAVSHSAPTQVHTRPDLAGHRVRLRRRPGRHAWRKLFDRNRCCCVRRRSCSGHGNVTQARRLSPSPSRSAGSCHARGCAGSCSARRACSARSAPAPAPPAPAPPAAPAPAPPAPPAAPAPAPTPPAPAPPPPPPGPTDAELAALHSQALTTRVAFAADARRRRRSGVDGAGRLPRAAAVDSARRNQRCAHRVAHPGHVDRPALPAYQGMGSDRPAREMRLAAVRRAAQHPGQLAEMMVEFWNNHFSTYSGQDDKNVRYAVATDDLAVIRRYAMGRFADLVVNNARSVSMLLYLDNHRSTGSQPNQNYARELMELHVLGEANGYDENDVEFVARIFTGWGLTGRLDTDGLAFQYRLGPSLHRPVEVTITQPDGSTSTFSTPHAIATMPRASRTASTSSTGSCVCRTQRTSSPPSSCAASSSDDPPPSLVASTAAGLPRQRHPDRSGAASHPDERRVHHQRARRCRRRSSCSSACCEPATP